MKRATGGPSPFGVTQPPEENLMSNVSGAQAQPVALSTNKARGGVTGHHVRYVLGFGLAGIIFAFIVMGLLFGFGSN
jgi:hypothetical protein